MELLDEFKAHVLAQASSTQCVAYSLLHLVSLELIASPLALAHRLKDPKVLLPTIIAGLQTYFDRALGANLLYRFERPQYAEIRKKYVTGPTVQVGQEKEMSAIYGAEHFLRMLGAFIPPSTSPALQYDADGLVLWYEQ